MTRPDASVAQPPIQLPGYTWVNAIYQGPKTVVHRAIEDASQQPVVIKCLHQDCPSFSELVRFRNQYTIAKNLSIPGVIRPLKLVPYGNGDALVLEDVGGISLEQYAQQQPLGLTETLGIAVQLAEILRQLHQQRVIHKDIKPANILIHPESRRVTLIDFSIASLLPKETQAMQSPQGLEGTLAYLAPEQSGRMNRAIDYRSDFYALGVTLYQLLTGQLPFTSTDPLALLHSHIAHIPTAIDQLKPEIPATVAAIVTKLMAKNAEDRYQSALGLKYDLEQCLIQWKDQGAITDLALGKRDVSDRFTIPEKLYGREAEVQSLLAAFDRVAQGASELMLVAGFSGIGKTAVVNEIHKPIVRQRGYFIKGKFDQFNRNIPFSAFVQAFRDLVAQLLSESDAALHTWKTQILEALGDNAQVIIDLIPELEKIVGPQPPAPALDDTAAQNRFKLLFQKFIHVFTTAEHPLVIFVDDLQWADAASLKLIQLLMGDTHAGHLLLIGAYRDNEVTPAHPLMLTLDDMGKQEAAIETLSLPPLKSHSLGHLITETLHAPAQSVQPLTELVMQKTQGNPFFATQFLNALHQDHLITFDPQAGHWQCDMAQVQVAALTNDVVELLAAQLKKLPDTTQNVLKLAACIGAQFDLNTLAIVSEQSTAETAAALWRALQEGLVVPTSEIYKFFQSSEPDSLGTEETVQLSYRFLHDRVQQAAYTLIPEAQKQQTHLKMGRLLWQETDETENCFEILNHLNIGAGLITDPQEQRSLRQLNLVGCQRAKLATAYGAALEYASVAMDLLPANPWLSDYDFVLALYDTTSEVAYLNTDFEQAETLIQAILTHTQQLIDSIKAYELLVQIYIAQDQQVKAIETGLAALKKLGVDLVEQSDWQQNLPSLPDPTTLNSLPEMDNPAYLAALRILISITPPTHHVKPTLFPAVVLTMMDLCDREGLSSWSAYAYGIYGLLLGAVVDDPEMSHRAGTLSLHLLEHFQADPLRTKINMLFAVFVCASKDAGEITLPLLRQGIEAGFESGDIEYVSYCIMAYFSNLLLVGRPLSEVEEAQQRYMPALEQFKQEHCIEYSKIWLQLAGSLTGDAAATKATTVEHFEATHNHQCLFAVHLAQLIDKYTFGDYGLAQAHGAKALSSQDAAFGLLLTAAHSFYYGLTLLAQVTNCAEQDTHQRQALLSQVATQREKLSKLAAHAPSNYRHKLDLILAEQARIAEQTAAAIDYYERAIEGANAAGYLQEEALANELAAKFYLGWGKEKVAAGYMQEAYYGYARWGAEAKVEQLEAAYPKLLSSIVQSSATSLDVMNTLMTVVSPTPSIHASKAYSASDSSFNQMFDFASILKASQALSSTVQLDELLQQFTQIILQNSGGDRVALILPETEDQWQIRAIATSQGIQLCTAPLKGNKNLPVKLIQYVKNTQEVVTFDNLDIELAMIDDYLRQHQPKSVLCLPILTQGRCIGVLSLENQVTEGAFTDNRILILNFLCTQAAISIENAQLFAETQKIETSLRKSREKLRTTANSLPGLVYQFRLGADGHPSFTYLSDRATELLEFDRHTLDHNADIVIQGIEPEDRQSYGQCLAHSQANLTPFVWTGRFRGPSGQLKWIEARSMPTLQADGACLWDGVMLDVSDRKIAEAALADSEAYHRNLFDKSSIGLLLCRMNGELIYANQAFADILGREKAELPALTYWEITPKTYADAEQAQLESLESQGCYGPYEKEYIHKDGRLIPVRLSGVIVERNGERLIWSSIEDISDRKHAEQVILQKSDDLEKALADLKNTQLKMVQSEKMSALGGLVAGVAHEINNPVGCIIGNVGATQYYIEDLLNIVDLYAKQFPNPNDELEEALEDLDLDYVREDLPKLIQAMKDSGERIKSISKSLRTFSRADTETKQDFNLREGLDSTVLILRHRLKANEHRPAIDVITEYDEIPNVSCFPGQLNQVFMNILANAIDALDEASQSRSFAELQETPNQISIRAKQEDQQVKITISDNGPGIPESVKAKIFEHLFTTKAVGKGTGLGLAIAHQIVVQTHQGSLDVQSQIGQGTAFCICLPIDNTP